jgi:hypothetical protein
MNILKREAALLAGIVLIANLAACSGSPTSPAESHSLTQSATPSTTTSHPEKTDIPSATSAPGAGTSSVFDDMPGLNDKTPKAKAIGKPPASSLVLSSDVVMGQYTNDTSLTQTYWASDWCHYFLGADGITYGESCVRAAPNTDGTSSTVQFQIYRYDPTKVEKLGDMVMELYLGYPGYTTYRDLTDPVFNQVQWAAFPTGIANLTADVFMASFLDTNGQLVWYSAQQIADMSGAVNTNVTVPQATVPAWDPAITVWSYPMISSINNQIASIPGAAY